MITFTVEGKPVPWARAGANGGQRFTPAKVKQYQSWVKLRALQAMQGSKPLDGALRLAVVAVFDIPKSWPKHKREAAQWHTSKPDGDNLLKTLKDAGNGILWQDDAQVSVASIAKRYAREGEQAGLFVEVEAL